MHIHQNINKFIAMGLLTSGMSLSADVSVESIGVNAGITRIKYIIDSQVQTTPKTVGSSFELYSTLSNVFTNKNIRPTFSYIYNSNSDVKNHTALVGLNQYYQFNYFNLYSGLLIGYGKFELNNDYSLKSVVGAAQVGLEFPMSTSFSFNFNSKFFAHNYESNFNSAPYMVAASVGLKYTFSATNEKFIVTDKNEKSIKKDDIQEVDIADEEWSFSDPIDLEPSKKESLKLTPKIVEKKVQKQIEVKPLKEKESSAVVVSKVVVPEEKMKKVVQKPSPKKVINSVKSEKKSFDEMNVDEMDFDWLLEEDFEPLADNKNKKTVDNDHDGVADKEDLCIDTIAGEIVDSSGCAKDSDGDGVIDRVDKCINSIVDEIVDERGCARDSDYDGIIDRLDRCSNSLANEIVDQNGCAKDSDGDGVVDRVDRCINSPKEKVVDEFGCSDKLIDTKTRIALYKDKPVEIVKPKVKKIKKQIVPTTLVAPATKVSGYPTRLNFPYKAQKVDPEQVKQLDKLAAYLIAHPEYELFMKSYTDSIGSAKYNYNLALKRAQSVTNQLVNRGVNRARISYESMGEKDPLVSNMLKSGREKNRRIDIFLIKR